MSSAKKHRETIWGLQAEAFDVVSDALVKRLMDDHLTEEAELMDVTRKLPEIMDKLWKEEKCILQCSHWFQRETLFNQAEKVLREINETQLRKLAELAQIRLEARVAYLENQLAEFRQQVLNERLTIVERKVAVLRVSESKAGAMNDDIAEYWLRRALEDSRGVIVYLNGVRVLIDTALGVLSGSHYSHVSIDNASGDSPAVMHIETKGRDVNERREA